jgi:hypothetical protein
LRPAKKAPKRRRSFACVPGATRALAQTKGANDFAKAVDAPFLREHGFGVLTKTTSSRARAIREWHL